MLFHLLLRTLGKDSNGLLITGSVQGSEVTFLVHTGANVTILKPSVLKRMPLPEQRSLDLVKTNMLLADGRSLSFFGRGRFNVAVGGVEVEHEMWIAEVELDGIFGMDFITEHDFQLTLGQGRFDFLINGKTIFCQEGGNSPRCKRITVGTTTVIPPKSEALVPSKLIDSFGDTLLVSQGQTWLTKKSQLLVARSLVETQQGVIPLRMLTQRISHKSYTKTP